MCGCGGYNLQQEIWKQKHHQMRTNQESLSTCILSLNPTMYIAQVINPPGYKEKCESRSFRNTFHEKKG